MDGKVTAMDINRNGEVVWTVDADKMPLLSSSLSQQHLVSDNYPYMLVPSLDGSLFMFNAKTNALSPIPLGTDMHIMIGDDEIAGGTFVTSTGVDPLNGKIRYRCTSGNCVQYEVTGSDPSFFTLIMRKNGQIARAADPVTGEEKWNVSVGEYDVSIVSSDHSFRFEKVDVPTHVNFLLEPPDGIVLAVDSCGRVKWSRQLSSPIAKVWQVIRGKIFEISLFSYDTLKALSDFSGNGKEFISKYEVPFYFGTVNSEPYIIPSEFMREELRHMVRAEQKRYEPKTFSSHNARFSFFEDLQVGDLIRRSYRTSSIVEMDLRNDASHSSASKSRSCNMYDAVTLVGSKGLQEIEKYDAAKGDLGWYIFKTARKFCQKSAPFHESDQKETVCNLRSHLCRRKNVLDGLKQIAHEPVSGWWKIIALFLTLIATLLVTVILHSREIRYQALFFLFKIIRKQSSEFLSVKKADSPRNSVVELTDNQKKVPVVSQSVQNMYSSKFLEDFSPEKWLGRGGYGVVFSCRNRLDDRNYAVKRIAVSNTSSAIEHVKREARAMARLEHPGIIRYFHTWMEKPPSGWQQAKDKEILKNIRSIADSEDESMVLTVESNQEINQARNPTEELSFSEKLSKLHLKTFLMDKDGASTGDTKDISWMNSTNGTGVEASTESESSTDSDSNLLVHQITAVAADSDDSSYIVFAHSENSSSSPVVEKSKLQKNGTPNTLDPPVVLVARCFKLCQELTLHSWLLNNKKDREINQMRRWLAELVCAIDYIHSQGLIHRDLKPQNIFFSADNCLKIGDLGLATNYISAKQTTDCEENDIANIPHTSNVGTRLYMSPEQLMAKPYNEKVDVFSLGLIFVELIIPFETVMERNHILSNLQSGTMPKCLDECRPEEKKFISWLTAVNPELRPSARELVECDYLRNQVQMLGVSYFREIVPTSYG
ncbi:unnamed protein product [Thelazia callipaeda]|uniref:PRKR-like endoplasmic reticulum kinase n=1 Tax=Thelazia callipaeda TaxID=103827 RepID=A0A0N5CPX5_THECL|nr:unnamed protein product [Thelazia callipaeda]